MLSQSLSEKLENEGTVFEFIALGKDDQDNDCLFVYIRPTNSKKLSNVPQEWEGVPVKYFLFGRNLKEIVLH